MGVSQDNTNERRDASLTALWLFEYSRGAMRPEKAREVSCDRLTGDPVRVLRVATRPETTTVYSIIGNRSCVPQQRAVVCGLMYSVRWHRGARSLYCMRAALFVSYTHIEHRPRLDMSWLSSLTLPALTLAGGCATYWAARYALDRSPLMDLPSPPRSSLLLGHFREAVADDEDLLGLKWMKEYGHVYKFYFLFNVRPLPLSACISDMGAQSPRVVITDLKAIGYILANPDAFPKPDATQNFLRYIFGDGLLVSQGAAHRMQRKIMNPAFGPTQLRELTGIFLDKANEVRVHSNLCTILRS
jgi:hypothetical protein